MSALYVEFYGLREMPFNLAPDPRFLYFSAGHKEALAQMIFGVSMRRGFMVLTGEVGTGKTTLIHAFLERLHSSTKTALIFHTILGFRGLMKNICRDFGLETNKEAKTDILMDLYDFLVHNFKSGGNAVLIIDEAQNLKPHILEEIRLLSNVETSRSKLLQILLVGQPQLRAKLERPQMRQLRQRVSLRFHLAPLNRQETREYINHRLWVAGCQYVGNLFTPEAVDEIYRYTQGVPRLINILCDNAMLMGYVMETHCIDRNIVSKVQFEDMYREMEGAVPEKPISEAPYPQPTLPSEGSAFDSKEPREARPFRQVRGETRARSQAGPPVYAEKPGKTEGAAEKEVEPDYRNLMARLLGKKNLIILKKPRLATILSPTVLIIVIYTVVLILVILVLKQWGVL